MDRHEDITNPNEIEHSQGECDRTIIFYGYVRGTHFKHQMRVHVIGVGDYDITEMDPLLDPCPIPEKKDGHEVKVRIVPDVSSGLKNNYTLLH